MDGWMDGWTEWVCSYFLMLKAWLTPSNLQTQMKINLNNGCQNILICILTLFQKYKGHSIRPGNCFDSQRWGNIRNAVHMFQSMWHVHVNATIRWGCMYRSHW
jgi:hypothetical protein